MLRVLADVDVDVTTSDGESLRLRIDSDGHTVTVRTAELTRLVAGQSTGALNHIASTLADRGVELCLCDEDGPVLAIGDVRVSWWHRAITRSRHVRVARWRAATALKASALTSRDGSLTPPPVEWPMLPAFPWWNRRVTTTHDPYGGGHPRLYLADTRVTGSSREVRELALTPGTTTIGSGEDAILRLDGIDPVQAFIERTADDEYELVAQGTSVHTFMNGRELPRQQLRTGSRIEMGPWRLTYVRDEHADHGRPYGGRIGGELGRQRSQEQPTYQR